MESKYTYSYDVSKSAERIRAIINENDSSFEEVDDIPERSKLTFTNGFYVDVCAIFIDIRESSALTSEHRRPKLAKLYRSYISEIVALLNSYIDCKEINIVGDCVSGIFNGKTKAHLQNVVNAAAQINSLVKIMNYYFRKNDIVEISIGIGITCGRALMIKAGYSGSTINDVVWMGDVVNSASNLCNKANKLFTKPILIDDLIYTNQTDDDKKLFTYNSTNKCYEADLINMAMDKWYADNCK